MSRPQTEESPSPNGEINTMNHRLRSQHQLSRLARLCAKELREILRDRRTIVTLVLMPILVYPILTLTFNSFLFSSLEEVSEIEAIVAFETEDDFKRFESWYLAWSKVLGNDLELKADENEPTIRYADVPDLRAYLETDEVHVGVLLNELEPDRRRGVILPRYEIELLTREGSIVGDTALEFLQKRIDRINASYDERILTPGLPSRSKVTAVKGEDGSQFAFSFASFVPLMLILMTITGAVYPAIDLTAGERERGTMEALIAAPVPRVGLLLAKYVAVLAVAILTATANLIAMTITLLSSQLGALLFGDGGISWLAMAQTYGLMILFAAFFSAILLAITSFARSFKEAQAYLIPLMLFSLGPGIISLMPGIEMNALFSVTPLLNLVLLARDSIQGNVNLVYAVVAINSTLVYAVAAITLAAKIFGTDAILYGSQASWSDLLRRPKEAKSTTTIASALLCLALMFPLQFVASSLVSKVGGTGITWQLPVPVSATLTSRMGPGSSILITGLPAEATVEGAMRDTGSGGWRLPAESIANAVIRADNASPTELEIQLVAIDQTGRRVPNTTETVAFTPEEILAGSRLDSGTLTLRLLGSGLALCVIFVGLPLLIAQRQNVSMSAGFQLHSARWGAWLAVVVLGVCLWPFAHNIVVFTFEFAPSALQKRMESAEGLATALKTVSPIVILLSLAVAPGVCEELFFRGFLLRALRCKMKPWQAIALSALLFGVFHMIGSSTLTLERVLPSTFLGVFLGIVCVRSGSVIPGMVLHTLHNGLLLMTVYYEDSLVARGWNLENESYISGLWLLGATALVAIGIAILLFVGSQDSSTQRQGLQD